MKNLQILVEAKKNQLISSTNLTISWFSNLPVIVLGFQNGPPFSSCLTLFPKHGGLEAQTTEPPYTVSVDEHNYSPGQEIHSK